MAISLDTTQPSLSRRARRRPPANGQPALSDMAGDINMGMPPSTYKIPPMKGEYGSLPTDTHQNPTPGKSKRFNEVTGQYEIVDTPPPGTVSIGGGGVPVAQPSQPVQADTGDPAYAKFAGGVAPGFGPGSPRTQIGTQRGLSPDTGTPPQDPNAQKLDLSNIFSRGRVATADSSTPPLSGMATAATSTTKQPAVAVNPLPMPDWRAAASKPADQPAAPPVPAAPTAPASAPPITQVDQPALLSQTADLLKGKLASSVKDDPRYLSQMADLQKQQAREASQRKSDMIRLGINKDDGSDFNSSDLLSEKHTRENLDLLSNIENLRNTDIQNALSTSGQQSTIGQQNVQNTFTQQAQDLSDRIQTGQLSIAEANQKMAETGQAGGQFALNPNTNKYEWKLTEAASEFMTAQTGQTPTGLSTLAKTGQEASIEATRAGLTGVAPLYNPDGTPAIDPVTKQQRTGTTLDAQKLGLSQAQVFGKSGPISAGTQTEEAQQNRAQNSLTQQGINVNQANLAAQIQIQQAHDAGTAFDPSTGKWTTSVEARQAESDISYKTGMLAEQTNARQKQNQLEFATLTGLVRDPLSDTTVKTMAQKELDNRKTVDDASTKLQRDIAEADRIGQMGGKDTVQYKTALQNIAESKAKVDQAWADLTGTTPGDTSPLAGTKTVAQQTLELTKTNAALQRAIDQGKATGKFIDPITGKDQTTLEAEISRGTLGVQQAQQGATERANIYQMTGRAPLLGPDGKVQMDAGTGKPIMMDTLENRIQTGQLALSQANTYGESVLIDPKTGAVQYTSDGKGNIVPITQKSIGADVAKRGMTDQENKTALAQQEMYGGFTGKNGKFVPTQAANQWTDAQKLQYANLAETTRATKAQEKQALATTLGYTDMAPGKVSVDDFRAAMRDSTSGKPFDTSMDSNGDGKVDQADFFDMQKNGMLAKPGETFSTLAAKAQQDVMTQAAWTFGLDDKKITEGARQFNASQKASNAQNMSALTGYVYDQTTGEPIQKKIPTVVGSITQDVVSKAWAATQTANGQSINANQPGYEKLLDFNDDGNMTFDEVMDGVSTNLKASGATAPNGQPLWQVSHDKNQPMTSIQRDEYNTQIDQYNTSTQNDLDKFLKTIGVTMDQIKGEKDSNKFSAWMGLLATVVGGAATVVGAAIGKGGNGKGGNNNFKVTIGTDGVKIGT